VGHLAKPKQGTTVLHLRIFPLPRQFKLSLQPAAHGSAINPLTQSNTTTLKATKPSLHVSLNTKTT
jgi:hypothetical protein